MNLNLHNNEKQENIFLDILEETFFSIINNKHKQYSTQSNDDHKVKNKIVMNDFKCQNNIEISNIIKNIKYYYLYYDVVISHQEIKIGEMNTNVLISNNIIPTEKIILLEYQKMPNIPFFPFFSSLPSPKLLIHHVLDSYTYLLKSIHKLHDNNIYFLPINQDNIVFNERYNPILSNFKNSLNSLFMDNDNHFFSEKHYLWIENLKENINDSDSDCLILPFDLFILINLFSNDNSQLNSCLNKNYATKLCNSYFKSFLNISFPKKEEYKNACLNQITQYLNKTKIVIIRDILLNIEFWDYFILNSFYLPIINDIIEIFSLKNTIINDFYILLNNSLIQKYKHSFILSAIDNLYEKNKDWTFVNTLSYEKMNEFKGKYKK